MRDTRDAIFEELLAMDDERIVVLSCDTGAYAFEELKKRGQFFNVGISEQNAISVAAGMAMEGKFPFVFGISNFVVMRCLEQISVDVCQMNLPVTIIGYGTGLGYSYDGPTHHIINDVAIMRSLPGMTIFSPSTNDLAAKAVHFAMNGPCYIRIDKGPLADLPHTHEIIDHGFEVLRNGATMIVTTSAMTQVAMDIDDVGVMDVFRLNPISRHLANALSGKIVVTLEEQYIQGGLASIVSEQLASVVRIGLHNYVHDVGSREYLREINGLNWARV